jgi:dolichol-phosphate mannosyltransferase
MSVDVDFVMPVYNEGANVAHAVEEIYRLVPLSKRILVVYDFDEDDTVPVVQRLAPRYPGLMLVKNTRGRGALNAMRTGLDTASAEAVVVTMADLSDDIAIVARMVALIVDGGYDVVCASRYVRGGRQLGGPLVKRTLSRLAGVSLHWLTGIPTHDATNSFRAYRLSAIRRLEIESSGGFELAMELTVKAFAAGLRITEIPSTWRDRSAGTSRFRLAAWLPHYLRWYAYALAHRPGARPVTAGRPSDGSPNPAR